jgi:HNH endonuclease
VALADVISPESVVAAVAEFDSLGREEFLRRHGFGTARRYFLRLNGRSYDSKAIVGVAYGYARSNHRPLRASEFSGGEATVARVLTDLGFSVVQDEEAPELTLERARRRHLWRRLCDEGPQALGPARLRELGIYGGAQGIWVDAERTRQISASGVTVGVLHTGRHYADDLSSDGIIYHYPRTNRPGSRDASEVEATKNAGRIGLPVFVVSRPAPASPVRDVNLGWVNGWSDETAVFLITFGDEEPSELLDQDRSDDEPFKLEGLGTRVRREALARTGQTRFRFQVLQRYGPQCAVTGLSILEALDAAHLRDVADGGSNDARNGLVLSSSQHRAFDAGLFGIHPDSLDLEVRADGPSLEDLQIRRPDIRHLSRRPHAEALRWRYQRWNAGA